MGEIEEFNTLTFEKKLAQLKDTQECIQSLSSWCLKQRVHHKKIVQSWLNVLKRVKMEQRLVLFYLANDVIQYSKRKNYEFVESWGLNLQKATPLVRDEKVRPKILRIFKIWEQRSVYDDEFLSDLTGLLSAGAMKKADDDPLDFQPQQLVNKIKQCSVLEADTDLRLKCIHESELDLSDADALCTSLKDRRNKDDVEKDLNEGIACVERYTQALQREIVAREALLALLTSANQYYSTQRGEVKVVAYAYKNFGGRVRTLKRKLDELVTRLPARAPSPPRRDEDVPSPGPDEDIDLPNVPDADTDVAYNIDKTFNTSLAADGSLYNLGLSSFLNSENPMSIFNENNPNNNNNANKIEVISSRPSGDSQDFNINDFLKTLIPNENLSVSESNSVVSGGVSQKSQDTLPGLDLLTPEADRGNPPRPTSFYGAVDLVHDEPSPQPYHPETSTWNNNTFMTSTVGVGGGVGAAGAGAFLDTPESPPPAPLPPPPRVPDIYATVSDLPTADVDHRGILPPPPPPPVLPVLGLSDVDHRNLISLTSRPQPQTAPRPVPPVAQDQDYRLPMMLPPNDIVESVDMDLSEDEDQQGLYTNPQNQNEHNRRQSFNNNKVLVGGDNGKTKHTNLIRINSVPGDNYREKPDAPMTAPIVAPIANPFDNMPDGLKRFNMPQKFPSDPRIFEKEENSNDSAFDEDLRSRGIEPTPRELRNPSPPEYENYPNESNWQNQSPRPSNMNQRFPRNWGPQNNFRPQSIGPQQFWPRNGPRTPNRWVGPRPQRFW